MTQYITPKEAALRLNLTYGRVRALIQAGKLVSIRKTKFGRPRYMVSVTSVEARKREMAA